MMRYLVEEHTQGDQIGRIFAFWANFRFLGEFRLLGDRLLLAVF
jgi:hypothetical protein